MSRFDDCMAWLKEAEGGFSNNQSDHGGATLCGVTQITYDRWRASRRLPLRPVSLMAQDEENTIYQEFYFGPARCAQLPAPVDLVMFDAWVNHRPTVSAQFLQNAVGVDDDGLIGIQTLNAVSQDAELYGAMSIAQNIIDQRRAFYRRIVEKDASQAKFLVGWENRMNNLSKWIGA